MTAATHAATTAPDIPAVLRDGADILVHWHPKRTWRPGPDGRIHALEGYRVHVEPMRRNRHDRLCDETTCERCVHDCECLDCLGWCQCDSPPVRAVYATLDSVLAAGKG